MVVTGPGAWSWQGSRQGDLWCCCVCRWLVVAVLLQGPKVLAKYVALYAAQLLTSGAALSALKLFRKFGTTANPQVSGKTVDGG